MTVMPSSMMVRACLVVIVGCTSDAEVPLAPVEVSDQASGRIDVDGALAFIDTASSSQTAFVSIDLINYGPDVLDYMSARFDGPDADQFKADQQSFTDGGLCGFQGRFNTRNAYDTGDHCRVELSFVPTSPGPKGVSLVVGATARVGNGAPDRSSTRTFAVRATGLPVPTNVYTSATNIDPARLDNTARSSRITNGGSSDAALGDLATTATVSASWDCPAILPAGGTCRVSLNSGCVAGSITTTTGAFTLPVTGCSP